MKTRVSVAALVATMMLAMSLSLPQAFGADEVKAALKGEAIDSSKLSPEMAEIAKLVQSGVDEAVVLAFIEKNALQRSPTADELIKLQQLGLSSKTMVALMNSVKKPAATAQVASEPRQSAAAVPALRGEPRSDERWGVARAEAATG